MSDPANPLKTYHQRQIDDQATPVRLYGENGGPATIQLSGSSLSLSHEDYSDTLNVPAGETTTIEITPPAGELWRVIALRARFPGPSGAGSGDHRLQLRPVVDDADLRVLSITAAYNALISIIENNTGTTSNVFPSTIEGQIRAIQGIVITPDAPLTLWYWNNTDVAQQGALTLKMSRLVEPIAE